MSEQTRQKSDKLLIGAVLLFGIAVGGNSAPSYYLDGVVQLLLVLTSGFVIWYNNDTPLDRRVTLFVLAVTFVVAMQLIPLPAQWLDSLQGILAELTIDFYGQTRPISLNIGRTLEALAWVLSLGLLLVAISKIDFEQAYGLVPVFLVGVLCHMVAGLVQYSSASTQVTETILGFTFRAGMFANSNHFSALIFISIPVAFAYFYDRRRLLLFLLYLIAALLVLLAVGSRAGVMIGFAVTILSALIIFRRNALSTASVLIGATLIGIYAIGLWARIAQEGLEQGAREVFARTTLDGIWDNLVLGVGYGNFVHAYPSYERTEDIVRYYANHAHNDFLELVFEGGIAAAILIALFLIAFFKRIIETVHWPLHYACALSILFLLLHSLVDYPLRTMAISISFCLMLALLFHRGMQRDEVMPESSEDEDLSPSEPIDSHGQL